ncbi:MAG: DUF4174 domain-containing protein [Janthinobacterium lividum]
MATISTPSQIKTTTLEALHNQRVLLVFGNGDNQLAEAQLDVAAKHVTDFHERDLVLAGLAGSDPAVPALLLSAPSDAKSRVRFHVKAGEFTVILIGRDGGEKLRSHQPILWETLQHTIDAMPMRQGEMRRKP